MKNRYDKDIKEILAAHSRLPTAAATLRNDSNLYDAGLTSLTTVHLMLAIEDRFDIEFEEHMLTRSVFQTIEALDHAIQTLTEQ